MELNNIYLGDAYELIKKIPDKSIDLIMTDPPYEIYGLHKDSGLLKGRKHSHNIELQENNLGDGINLKILDEFTRVLKTINIYLWCNKEQIYDYITYFVKEKRCNFEIIVWGKPNPAPFINGHYLKDKEYCLFFWEKGTKLQGSYETLKTYYIMNSNVYDKNKFKHPTIKPEEIIKTLINNSCKSGVVFDPFVGSGTTCVCAKKLGLNYLGFEINEKYFKIAVDRLNGFDQNGNYDLLNEIY